MAYGGITPEVKADFNGDGTPEFSLLDYITDITGGFTTKRGVGADRINESGTVTITLDNNSQIFTPGLTTSALYNQLVPGVKIWIRFMVNSTGVQHKVWAGRIQEYVPSFPGSPGSTMQLVCEGYFSELALQDALVLSTSATRKPSDAWIAIVEAAGFTSSDYTANTSTGLAMPQHWNTGDDALTQIAKVMPCELGGATYEGGDGKLIFRNRQAYLGGYASPTQTWGDNGTVKPSTIVPEYRWKSQFAKQRLNYNSFVTTASHTFWSMNAPYYVATGETYTLFAEYDEPSTGTVAVTLSAFDNSDGTGTNRSANFTQNEYINFGPNGYISYTNTGPGAYIVFLTFTGTVIVRQVTAEALEYSLAVPNLLRTPKGPEITTLFLNQTHPLKGYTYGKLMAGRHVSPWVTVAIVGDSNENATAVFGTEIGDLIRLTDSGYWKSYVDDFYRVESCEISWTPNELAVGTFVLSPAHLNRDGAACVFDRALRADTVTGLGVSESGHTWAGDTNWQIVSNTIRPKTIPAGIPYVGGFSPLGSDNVMRCELSNMSGTHATGIAIGESGLLTNHWRVINDYAAAVIRLTKLVGGVTTTVGTYSTTTSQSSCKLEAHHQDTRWRVFYNDKPEPVIEVTDSALRGNTYGYPGLYHLGSLVSGVPRISSPYWQAL